jgi:hypothetical protein
MLLGKIQYGNLFYLLHQQGRKIVYELVYQAAVPVAVGYFLQPQYFYQKGFLHRDLLHGFVFELQEEREISEKGFRQFQQILEKTLMIDPEKGLRYIQYIVSDEEEGRETDS